MVTRQDVIAITVMLLAFDQLTNWPDGVNIDVPLAAWMKLL